VVERAVSLGVDAALPAEAEKPARARARPDASRPYKEVREELVGAFERDYVADLLERSKGNLSAAARNAGIDRAYLRRLIHKHALNGK